MSESDCLFCKILNGSAAADVVYQDVRCVVIRDTNPQAPTHLLVVPREHMESLDRSEEHTSELQSRGDTSYAVFCLKKKHRHRVSPREFQRIVCRRGRRGARAI